MDFGKRIHNCRLCGCGCSFHPVARRAVAARKAPNARCGTASLAWRLAVFATLVGPGAGLWWLVGILLIPAGGIIGYQLATRVQMTQMPELVAACTRWLVWRRSSSASTPISNWAMSWRWTPEAKKGLEGFAKLLAKKDAVEISRFFKLSCSWASSSARSPSPARSLPMASLRAR